VISESPTATDVLVNNNTGSTGTQNFTQSEQDLVAFGNTIVVGFNDSGSNATGSHFTGWSRSTDGGATFVDGGLLPTMPRATRATRCWHVTRRPAVFISRRSAYQRQRHSNVSLGRQRSHMDGPGQRRHPAGASMDKQWHVVDNFAGAGNGNVYLMGRNFWRRQREYVWR